MGRGKPILVEFWTHCQPVLRVKPVIWTSRHEWATAAESCLLRSEAEAVALPVLESLDIRIVHEDLRPHFNLLRNRAVGVGLLDVRRVVDALASLGIEGRKERSELPSGLQPEDRLKLLWKELAILCARTSTEETRKEDIQRLSKLALAPGRDGALWPCKDIFKAEPDTVSLFERFDLQIPFLERQADFPDQLEQLCPQFDAKAAIQVLENAGVETLEGRWRDGMLPISELMDWFENRRSEILGDSTLKRALANLPIFPSANRLQPLKKLLLPGDFEDRLGVARLVDLAVLGDRRSFLRDLGAEELDFRRYAEKALPEVLSASGLPAEKKREAVLLLARRLGELKSSASISEKLRTCAIVECQDAHFRSADQCYFDNQTVRDCLGDSAPLAIVHESDAAAIRDLYEWLGVSSQPRLKDVVAKLRELTAECPSTTTAGIIQRIFTHLGERTKKDKKTDEELEELKQMQWLPARGKVDRWYAPRELYAGNKANLFESQALILDFPIRVQNSARDLLQFLGVRLNPEPVLVVRHLLYLASQGHAVDEDMYDFLNDNSNDHAVKGLCGKACLWIDGAYHRPDEVFWSEHPFGRYRWRLGDELKNYVKFLSAIGVRETPAPDDFLKVLKEISKEFVPTNRALDDEAHSVLWECWRGLNRALREGKMHKRELVALHTVKCVPDKEGVLNRPDWMFFENRAGLAEKFGSFLSRNVIPRPVDTADALAAAGVRPLGAAVQTELLESRGQAEDPELRAHILNRRDQIARVLDASGDHGDTGIVLDRLNEIQFYMADSIEIRYRLVAFDREKCSAPEQVPALYLPASNALIYVRREHELPWPSIARELAIALYPEEDPGRFAAGLKEAIAAKTSEDATRVLDELGFERLDASVAKPPVSGNWADRLGTETCPESDADQALGSPVQTENEMSSEKASQEHPGQNAPGPDEQSGSSELLCGATGSCMGFSGGSSDQPGRQTGRKPTGSRKGGIFISYIAVEPDEQEPDPDKLAPVQRQALEEAAISHILAVEPALRRTPRHNPGYDLFEPDEHGNPVRWIEVKAMTGSLADRPVGMSYKQFTCAQEHGAAFWLYIVEQAGTANARLVRIQDPAGKARTFTFDRGWLAVADIENRNSDQQDKGQDCEDRHPQD